MLMGALDLGRLWFLQISLRHRYKRGFNGGHGCCSGDVIAGDGCRCMAGW